MRYEFFKFGDRTVGYDISLEDSIGRSLMGYALTIVIFLAIAAISATVLPLILFIMYFYSVNNQKWLVSLLGAIVSFYFLIDYSNGYICHALFTKLFDSVKWFDKFCILNLALLIMHLLLFIYRLMIGKDEEESAEESNTKMNMLWIGLFAGLMFFGSVLLDHGVVKRYVEPVKTEYTC